ncbi:MAG: hypothetical protein CMR00_06015 [[Chlorobium] sp. 445]|nr:MAG: hypothetical protein CMR00_06015 [[Chlorobium] sp. 445]
MTMQPNSLSTASAKPDARKREMLFHEIRAALHNPDVLEDNILLNYVAALEKMLAAYDHVPILHYYIALASVRYAIRCINRDDEVGTERSFETAMSHLEKALTMKSDLAEAHILEAYIYAQRIIANPAEVMKYALRIAEILGKAKITDPNNPRLHLVEGITSFLIPESFGGGLKKALEALNRAEQSFKTYQLESPMFPDWGKEEVYAWLGKIAFEEENYGLAKQYYQHALSIKPDYDWVKNTLMVELNQKR